MPSRTTARSRVSKARRLPTRGNATQSALAERIVGWLRQRDLKPGDHVPERLATEAFHVSRTPVRAALALLTERGLLERRDQRGYFVVSNFDAAGPAV
ncbi:MAG TPA: winged helix-turn-helix domain-containing protein, partial [Dongiaceae bacterium]|nr:winged helix-turn-helix domain-containing protein [Dongiaceae bacterium]